MFHEFKTALEETFFIVFMSGLLTIALGTCLSILFLWLSTHPQTIFKKLLYPVLNSLGSAYHSIPYVVLLILCIPFFRTHLISETQHFSVILSLTLATFIGFALQLEKILKPNNDLHDLMNALGASFFQKIFKISLKENFQHIMVLVLQLFHQLLGYSLIAGLLGAGGLGKLLMQKGYQQMDWPYTVGILILLLIFSQLIRFSSRRFVHD